MEWEEIVCQYEQKIFMQTRDKHIKIRWQHMNCLLTILPNLLNKLKVSAIFLHKFGVQDDDCGKFNNNCYR
jgi:hypothetical protein